MKFIRKFLEVMFTLMMFNLGMLITCCLLAIMFYVFF